MRGQVRSALWVLNGMSILNQALNYSGLLRRAMFEPDVLALQVPLLSFFLIDLNQSLMRLISCH